MHVLAARSKPSKSARIPQIMLTLLIAVLSTLWVQITMHRQAPFLRTAQCFFNEIILQHDSQDIYEGDDVIYWRTAEYYDLQEIYAVYQRLNQTLLTLQQDSLFQIDPNATQKVSAKLLAKYSVPNDEVITRLQFFSAQTDNLTLLFDSTFANRTFWEYLWTADVSFTVPIIYREERVEMELKVMSTVFSGLLVEVKLEVSIGAGRGRHWGYKKDQERTQDIRQNLTIRKRNDPKDMQLSMPYLPWIIVALMMILFILQVTALLSRHRQAQRQNFTKQKQEQRIQRLLKIRDDRPLNAQPSLVQTLGAYRIVEVLLTGCGLLGASWLGNGVVCCLFWVKVTVLLGQTGNKYMVGLLFEQAIPIYLKILLNLVILITAFVLFNRLVYNYSSKFDTMELSYFQYIFNYFQYGIYQNFIKAYGRAGMLAQFFYFCQSLLLLYIGNNLLLSVLSNQVSKRSNLQTIEEMLGQVRCPHCNQPPSHKKIPLDQEQKKVGGKGRKMMSRLLTGRQTQIEMTSQHIIVQSPLLSPFFPQRNQEHPDKFNSPALKGGKLQKHLRGIRGKSVAQSRMGEVQQLQERYGGKGRIEIQQSELEQNQQHDKHLRNIRNRLKMLDEAVRKLSSSPRTSPNTNRQVLSVLLQRIQRLRRNWNDL